jgi:hypothetical protein
MIDTIIFSKDRPAQLELLIRSIKDNFKEIYNVNVLYKVTSEQYKKGYEKVKSLYPNLNWIEEKDFVKDYINILDSFEHYHYALILVDDEVVVDDIEVQSKLIHFSNNDLHCISLRMHPDITYCYTANLPSPLMQSSYSINNNVFFWDWRKYDSRIDLGYPSCINSHIYQVDWLRNFSKQLSYQNVNQLEGCLNLQRNFFKPFMMCFNKPKTINIAANLVQTGTNRYSGLDEFTTENLNIKFLSGYRISTQNLYGLKMNTPTFEYHYVWEKE